MRPLTARRAANRQGGFTLLEVLAALVVLGFVVAGLSQGLRFGLRAMERQERLSVQRGDVEAVDRLLRRLVTHMDPGTSRDPSGLTGGGGRLAFVTQLADAGLELGTGAAEVSLGTEGKSLVLLWRPVRHVVSLGTMAPSRRVSLIEGVERLEVRYWGADGNAAPAWRDAWQGPVLPLLVRIRLVFSAGPERRWPDIVAGPARPRPWS